MSALNVTQEEADLLMVSLKMYADVHQNASGVVPEDVAVLMAKLTSAPVVAETPAVEEEKPAKAKKAKAEEAPAEEAPPAE